MVFSGVVGDAAITAHACITDVSSSLNIAIACMHAVLYTLGYKYEWELAVCEMYLRQKALTGLNLLRGAKRTAVPGSEAGARIALDASYSLLPWLCHC